MKLTIPKLSLVLLVGASGSGKSTFARKHFLGSEVLSSDFCRGLVCDDENSQEATNDAFDVLHFIAAKRLAAGRLTVVDATNVQPESRKPLVELARAHDVLAVAIVFNLPEQLCQARNRERPDRAFGPHVVRNQSQQLRRSLRNLRAEGLRYVYVLDSPEAVEAATIERQPLYNDRREEHGPFDIIGDIHGCYAELVTLLEKLGYEVPAGDVGPAATHPQSRKAVFLGDLADRGPRIPEVLRLVMSMVAAGTALCIPGNHDVRLLRKLNGKDVRITHGLADSLTQLDAETETFRAQVATFIDGLVSHYVLDDSKLVVAHAGMLEAYQGRASARVRDFALFGETTGESDEFGLPIRYNWASDYRGQATVVYGHTPVPEPEWLNRTINIDTGCVFGGRLTALRYPERELMSVPSARVYAQPAKPFLAESVATTLTTQQTEDELLDLGDVTGKRILSTRLYHNITVREGQAAAALEIMSRFAVNPKWLIYLPPTMSPPETSRRPDLLEHPAEAFAYYRHAGVPHVVCEAKHMGSRAVVVLCRDEDVARRRFGIVGEGNGIIYTRTGRRFFENTTLEAQLLDRVRAAVNASLLWDTLKTDWLCLDCELMPWSAKAQELLRQQYAAVGAASRAALAEAIGALALAASHGVDIHALVTSMKERLQLAELFVASYRQYCWPVRSLEDLKLAPFHLLASEGTVHSAKDHIWHMQTLAEMCAGGDGVLLQTQHKKIDVTDTNSEAEGTTWWEELTGAGGEGMVVKPLDFVTSGQRGLIQPAIKCRGREYLRIIYGAEYTRPDNLVRLRERGLGAKRSLALREFALGVEGLERFVRREPLRRVHECVFGVLALESEDVDPRL
jgi:protein phosphatase